MEEEVYLMPRGDKTGPMGYGPMTGRGAGFCAGLSVPGFANSVTGPGFRRFYPRNFGGRGHRHWFHATGLFGWQRAGYGFPVYPGVETGMPVYAKADEINVLKGQATYLEQAMEAIKKRLDELESAPDK